MEKLFGTDGVRGIPGKYPLTPGMIEGIAFTAAKILLKLRAVPINGTAPLILMARDTRASGTALARSLVEGFQRAGCRTMDLGVAPTPAVSYLTPRVGALCGVMISASHNPAEFNGIKFFMGNGFKMEPSVENEIERQINTSFAPPTEKSTPRRGVDFSNPSPTGRGLIPLEGGKLLSGYLDFLRSTFPATLDLTGLKIVVDCGNGAASKFAPALLEGLGASVIALSCSPNGKNINDNCGALYPAAMQNEILRRGADCGVSFDGDADRAIFADEKGRLLDGDALICLSAMRLRAQGLLREGKVVLTVMSNFGLLNFFKDQGVSVVSVPVGDRHVTEAIEKEALSLGGEASGHIVFRSFAATGDGMLTAVQTLAAMRESGKPLSFHRGRYHPTPQIIKNIRVARKTPLRELPVFEKQVKRCEAKLGSFGRIFVRYSGTEPLLRIMIEGPRESVVRRMARDLAEVYTKEVVRGKK